MGCSNFYNGIFSKFFLILSFFSLLLFSNLSAGESFCATVKIEIKQELSLERQAFEAHMKINNGQEDASLYNVKVNVNFTDDNGNTVKATSDTTDASAAFYIRVDRFENISDVTGSGVVTANSAADIYWLIIPAPGAGGKLSAGKTYYVGATIQYDAKDKNESITVAPDYIRVKPMPELALDYFIPQYVFADDPFTDEIETEVPFDLGVRVKNMGFGDANNMKIESAQPKIVEIQRLCTESA